MEETTPHQLQRVYATICYKWRCSLEGKVRCTSVGASTISCPQLVLRHTLTRTRFNRHIHTHAERQLNARPRWRMKQTSLPRKKNKKTLTLSHSGWFTGPRAHTVISSALWQMHQFTEQNYFSYSPPISPKSAQASLEPAVGTDAPAVS